jgi:hypothetical protein
MLGVERARGVDPGRIIGIRTHGDAAMEFVVRIEARLTGGLVKPVTQRRLY